MGRSGQADCCSACGCTRTARGSRHVGHIATRSRSLARSLSQSCYLIFAVSIRDSVPRTSSHLDRTEDWPYIARIHAWQRVELGPPWDITSLAKRSVSPYVLDHRSGKRLCNDPAQREACKQAAREKHVAVFGPGHRAYI